MSQLSRPYQIGLAAIVVLAIAWFTVLKPSDGGGGDDGAPLPGETSAAATTKGPTAPGAAGLGRAVDKANGAVAQSEAAPVNGLSDQGAGTAAGPDATPATPAASPEAKPAPTAEAASAPTGDASKPLLDAVADGKVAALLFYNPEGADDRATRRALLAVDRRQGRLLVRAASIKQVAKYGAITTGVSVAQSPTLLVFGADKQARTLTGYVDSRSIDQLVADVGGPKFVSTTLTGYPAKLGNLCRLVRDGLDADGDLADDVDGRAELISGDLRQAQRDSARLEVPKRFRAFNRTWIAYLDDIDTELRALQRRLAGGVEPLSAFRGYLEFAGPADRDILRAADKANIAC